MGEGARFLFLCANVHSALFMSSSSKNFAHQVRDAMAPLPLDSVEVTEEPDRAMDIASTKKKLLQVFPKEGKFSAREEALILMSYARKRYLPLAQHALFNGLRSGSLAIDFAVPFASPPS